MVRSIVCASAAAVLLAGTPGTAAALIVEPFRPGDTGAGPTVKWQPPNGPVLWVRDCGVLTRDDPKCDDPRVNDPRSQFSAGDWRAIDAELRGAKSRGRPYSEVWLYSGGGNSNEGFLVGAVLRTHQTTVRVPPGAFCASACTVAFMGGFFRYIDVDQGARYLVHSASQWRNGLGGDPDIVNAVRANPAAGLAEYARQERTMARYSARRRLRHFQQTLLLPLGVSEQYGESDESLRRWAVQSVSMTVDSNQRQRDADRIGVEGDPAIQDVLMRMEREAMQSAIADLRAIVGSLGPRAERALQMIEAMFQTGILETATLSRETLLQMGFVTKDFIAPAKE